MEEDKISLAELMNNLFKYRGTNCSAVAKELGMSRQALYRMIRGGTIKMDVFLRILDVLDIDMRFSEKGFDCQPVLQLVSVPGERIRQKIKKVVYDTEKMFFMVESGYQEHQNRILCWEPVANMHFIAHYFDDGQKPYLEMVDVHQATDFYEKYKR